MNERSDVNAKMLPWWYSFGDGVNYGLVIAALISVTMAMLEKRITIAALAVMITARFDDGYRYDSLSLWRPW